MKYISWFSGIGGFDLALNRAGHERVGACEIDDHARRVYEARLGKPAWFPNDIMEVKADDIPEADIWCGGSPCQGFSVAGKRGGLEDDRSGLLRAWLDLAAQRRPRWLWLENVPGILSVHGGRDFGELISRLDELGYVGSWATLDARYFGVAQRRRRVFVVAHLGEGADPSAVLLEPEGRGGNPPPGSATRARIAPRAAVGSGNPGVEVAGTLGGGSGKRGYPDDLDRSGAFIPMDDPAMALNAHGGGRRDASGETFVPESEVPDVAFSLAATAGRNKQGNRVGNAWNTTFVPDERVAPALRTNPYNNSDPGMESRMLVGAPEGVAPPDAPLDGQIGLFDDVEAIQCHGGNVGPMGALRRGNGNSSGGVPVAFTQNQREEVRLVGGDGDGVAALSSQPGSHQQSFVKIDEVASPLTASAGHHGHSSPRGDGRDNLVVGALTANYSTGTASHPNRTQRGDGLVIDAEPQVVQGDSAASTPDLPSLRANDRAGENAVLLDDAEPTYCIEDPGRKESGGPEVGLGVSKEVAYTLQAGSKHAVASPLMGPMAIGENQARGPSVRLMPQTSPLSGSGGKPGQGYQAVLVPPEDRVTAFSSKDSGGDASVDLSPTLRSGVHKDSHANGGAPPAVSGGSANAGVVRRLTPTECERLQGFTIESRLATIQVCSDLPVNGVRVDRKSPKLPKSVSGADDDAPSICEPLLSVPVFPAAANSSPNDHIRERHVGVSVLIDFGRNALEIRSHARLSSSASGVVASASYPLPMSRDLIARAVALMRLVEGQEIIPGKVVSRTQTESSSPHPSGGPFVELSGRETAALVSAAGDLTDAVLADLKSIISNAGLGSLISASIHRTLCSYVLAAIASFIPEAIRRASSFEVDLLVKNDGWTCLEVDNFGFMPDGTPYSTSVCKCSDSPRYKALGNAVAVPVVEWIAVRLARAEGRIPA